MSNLKTPNPSKPQKKSGLGRGLGSLLGGGPSFDEALTPPVNSHVDTQMTTHIPAQVNTQASLPTPAAEVATIEKPHPTAAPSVQQNQWNSKELSPAAAAERLNQTVPKIPPEARIWQIDIDKIVPNQDQPRKKFDPEALQSLAASIKEKGILQPITVRRLENQQFEIIAGERRWRAAQLAGLHRVPVILKNADNQLALELALIENIQRKDLNVIEEAEAYRQLMDEYDLTQQELADRVGKDRASVANILRLLNLTPEVRQMVINEEVSLGQAKVLLSVSDPKLQKKLALKVKNDRLTVRGTEKLVNKWRQDDKQDERATSSSLNPLIEGLTEELQKMLGTKVAIDYSNGKGKLTIHYYSNDELNEIVEKLRSACKR